jgi:hypothetical protein
MTTPSASAGLPRDAGNARRELRYLLLFVGFGLLVLPLVVYLAGALTLGPYDGGLPAFLKELYGGFVTLSPGAALLLLGPYVLFQAVRLLSRPYRRERARRRARGRRR